MEIKMKNMLLAGMLMCIDFLPANQDLILSEKFVEYHLQAAVEEIEDEDTFYLIQENVDNLKNVGISNDSADELINLIQEGYKIDPFNMAKLIETLKNANASDNATRVLVCAIEHNSTLTTDHILSLIQTLTHANASNNATAVLIAAIGKGIKFNSKERLKLAEVSKVANARSNVERVRNALHEREMKSCKVENLFFG